MHTVVGRWPCQAQVNHARERTSCISTPLPALTTYGDTRGLGPCLIPRKSAQVSSRLWLNALCGFTRPCVKLLEFSLASQGYRRKVIDDKASDRRNEDEVWASICRPLVRHSAVLAYYMSMSPGKRVCLT